MGLEIQKPTVSKICVAVSEPVQNSTGVVESGNGVASSQVHDSSHANLHVLLSESSTHLENKVEGTSTTKEDGCEGASRAAQVATPTKQTSTDTHTS